LAQAIFCLTAAVTAAAVIDPGVEWLANQGCFGPGTFTDHSNLDVIPALGVGLCFAAAFVAVLVRRILRRSAHDAPNWLCATSIARGECSLARLVPAIFALQLLVLWSMESLEQIAVNGHPSGGTIWLGGPIFASLVLHAAGTLGIAWLLSRGLRWSAKRIVDAVAFVRALFCELTPPRPQRRSRAVELSASRFFEPILARLNGRAPPYLRT
jgi:hypothetical protein